MKHSAKLILILLLTMMASSCARFSIWEKSALIITTAGTASTLIMTSNYASAGASVASGVGTAVIGGAASMIIEELEATPSEINAVEAAGQRYLAAISAEKIKQMTTTGKNLIAISVARRPSARGEASVMVYDLKRRKVSQKKIYELRATPKVGDSFKFEMGEAEFVGYIPMIGRKPVGTVASPVNTPLAAEPKP
jgi:hypothetical protein